MFGLDKLKQIKKQAEEMKLKLDSKSAWGESHDGSVKVEVNGSKKGLKVDINQSALHVKSKEDMDMLVLEAVNCALDAAQKISENEMKGMMPNIPGLG